MWIVRPVDRIQTGEQTSLGKYNQHYHYCIISDFSVDKFIMKSSDLLSYQVDYNRVLSNYEFELLVKGIQSMKG